MNTRVFGLIMCVAIIGGCLASVFVPFPDSNFYFLECGLLTAWLISDGLERSSKPTSIMLWATASLLLAPLVVARWYANRPLLPGECRKGGTEANFYNAFGLVTLMYTGVSSALNFLNYGSNRGFELIINAGFAVAGTAFVLALAARKDTVLEKGHQLAPERAKVEKD